MFCGKIKKDGSICLEKPYREGLCYKHYWNNYKVEWEKECLRENPEYAKRRKEQHNEWYSKNKEKAIEASRKWQQKNKEHLKELRKARLINLKNNNPVKYELLKKRHSQYVKERSIRRRESGLCVYCGKLAEQYKGICDFHYTKYTRRRLCRVLWKTHEQLKDDKESLLKDNDFVKSFVGFTCPRIEKETKETKT